MGDKTLEGRLVEAVKAESPAMVPELLAAGAKPDAEDVLGHRALDHAVWAAQPDCLEALLLAGARVDRERHYPGSVLTDFAAHMGPECARILLGAGADPMGRNDDRRTPLMLAALAGNAALIQALLLDPRVSRPSHLNSVDRDGVSALGHAERAGRLDASKALSDAGADPTPRASRRGRPRP